MTMTIEQIAASVQREISPTKDDIRNYFRVGDKYYKWITKPSIRDIPEKILIERKKGTIQDDFGRASIKNIRKYDDFICIPEHIDFKQSIGNFYNSYHPISHTPQQGSFNTVIAFLKHIFGEAYLDFIMDYLTLLYKSPTQRLPILLLESEAKNTGKSTFGSLVNLIFEHNVVKLGNSDLQSTYNSLWTSKLLIIVDETQLEKSAVMQMIKRFSTENDGVVTNEKFKVASKTDFFGKFIFISNQEGGALPIERDDDRFAVFKVPTFAEKGMTENANILKQLKIEIPAFLGYLYNRKMVYKDGTRMYFDKSIYFTPQLELYQANAYTYLAKSIKGLICDTFVAFENVAELNFSVSNLLNELKRSEYISKQVDRQQVKRALAELKVKFEIKGRYTFHSLGNKEIGPEFAEINQNNTFCTFKRADFLK